MAKKNKSNKFQQTQPAKTDATAFSTIALAMQSAEKTKSTIKIDNKDVVSVSFKDIHINELEKVDVDKKIEIEKFLVDITVEAKRLKELADEAQKRSAELDQKETAFAKKSDDNKKYAEELKKRDEELKLFQDKIKKSETLQADKERDLVQRELDARSGFAAQNVAALNNLKIEIAELESRKNEVQLGIHKAEQKALDDESARAIGLIDRENDIAKKERSVLQERRRLDSEWEELKRDEKQIKENALLEANQQIAKEISAKNSFENRLNKSIHELNEVEVKLEQYREFSDALAGRSARVIIDELAAYKRKVVELEDQYANNQDNQLASDNKELRKIRDKQNLQLDEVHIELADTKASLHRLRLGVGDKENLEREKRSLEKNNQILGARLNDLGRTVDDLTKSQESEKPFPQLVWMDSASDQDWIKDKSAKELGFRSQEVPDLKTFSQDLQHRIAQAEKDSKLYFRMEDIRLLIAGLAMSQLHIFQGISGTGKTSLAKAFAKAVGGHCTDIAVQAGWRDRDDLLGHYNAFEKRFYERDCLQGLYRAQTSEYKDRCNIILLDEMNLSRPEQYFAEFLSALEKNDPNERLISLSESELPNAPALLVEGRKIRVPNNVWFIGTANHDETTNEFADKTYDRAHVMNLPRHEDSFKIRDLPQASFSYTKLMQKFDEAISQNDKEVKEMLDELTTGNFTDILQERFDLGWGNRFERQAMRFVPVFMAVGGSKEQALDHLLASRVFRRGKVTSRYDATIEDLTSIEKALTDTWKLWKLEPKESLRLLNEDRRHKERGA